MCCGRKSSFWEAGTGIVGMEEGGIDGEGDGCEGIENLRMMEVDRSREDGGKVGGDYCPLHVKRLIELNKGVEKGLCVSINEMTGLTLG